MNKVSRIILHIDMNCFFASCEIAQNEYLRGKPIIVAHNDPLDRGLIVSPSYEARAFGIKTTMHVKDAKKLCPQVIVVTPHYDLYQENSKKFHQYLLKITDQVEMASIDEAYVDVTSLNLGAKTVDLAKKIQDDLVRLYKLPTSIGIAPNKLLAKIGSDYKKPMGITIMRKREVPEKLWPLPISSMMYIGKMTAPKLIEMGIKTIGDLANFKDTKLLEEKFGPKFVSTFIPMCHGIDESPVVTSYGLQTSYSHDHTFMNDVFDSKILLDVLHVLTNELANDMQNDNQVAYNFGIKLKKGFDTVKSFSKPLENASNKDYYLFKTVKDLFWDHFEEGQVYRFVGVFTNRVSVVKEEPRQLTIFDDLDQIEKDENIKKLLDSINNEFGKNSIKKGFK